jgi:hypothetical protein
MPAAQGDLAYQESEQEDLKCHHTAFISAHSSTYIVVFYANHSMSEMLTPSSH